MHRRRDSLFMISARFIAHHFYVDEKLCHPSKSHTIPTNIIAFNQSQIGIYFEMNLNECFVKFDAASNFGIFFT